MSLASKSTESPRRFRELLLPAHRLLQSSLSPTRTSTSSSDHPITQNLSVPSAAYDTLRTTLVQAEFLLLRVLGFDLRLPLASNYLERYLERAMERINSAGEDYEGWSKEAREEYGVESAMDTRIARDCRSEIVLA